MQRCVVGSPRWPWSRSWAATTTGVLSAPAASTSSDLTRSIEPATTTAPMTPTTASPLSFIAGCPDPGPLAHPDPQRPRYEASVSVDPPSSSVTGSMVVTFIPDLPIDELVFRLWANAPVPASSGAHLAVEQVTHRSERRSTRHELVDPTTLHVAVGASAGETVSVRVAFTLTVPRNNDDRIAHAGDTMRLGSFLPLLAWEPGVGWATEPATAIHGEAATSPAADYDVARRSSRWLRRARHRCARRRQPLAGDRRARRRVQHRPLRDRGAGRRRRARDRRRRSFSGRRPEPPAEPHRRCACRTTWRDSARSRGPLHGGGDAGPQRRHRVPVARDARSRFTRPIDRARAGASVVLLAGRQQPGPRPVARRMARVVRRVRAARIARTSRSRSHPVRGARPCRRPDDVLGAPRAPTTTAGLYVQGAMAVASLGTVDQVDCALRQYVARNAFRIATTAGRVRRARRSCSPTRSPAWRRQALHP